MAINMYENRLRDKGGGSNQKPIHHFEGAPGLGVLGQDHRSRVPLEVCSHSNVSEDQILIFEFTWCRCRDKSYPDLCESIILEQFTMCWSGVFQERSEDKRNTKAEALRGSAASVKALEGFIPLLECLRNSQTYRCIRSEEQWRNQKRPRCGS